MVLAKPRAHQSPRTWPSGSGASCGCRPTLVARTEIAGPGLHQLLAGRGPARGAARARSSAQGRGLRPQRPRARASRSTSSSSPPTRPARCTWVTAAARRWATRSPSLLEWTGHAVTREFYINDAGVQIDRLAAEPLGPGAAGGGPRRRDPRGRLSRRVPARERRARCSRAKARASPTLPSDGGRRAVPARSALAHAAGGAGPRPRRLRRPLRRDDARSRRIYDGGPGRARARAAGASAGLTYEKDGALWLRTTDFGDDKDRVLRKQDGTLHLPRARHRLPHRQARARLRSRDRRLGRRPPRLHPADARGAAGAGLSGDEFFDVELVQLVKVMRGGEEVKMSKRAGEFVTLRDLVDEVGVDAARYFFLIAEGRRARSTSTSTWPSGRPTRTRSSTCRWRTPG